MWGLSGGSPGADFYDSVDNYIPTVDSEDVSSYPPEYRAFYQLEEDPQPVQTSVTAPNPLASSLTSVHAVKGSIGPRSEAAPKRGSPDIFTARTVTESHPTHRNDPISADLFVRNNTGNPPASANFNYTSHGQQLPSRAQSTSSPLPPSPLYSAYPLASPRGHHIPSLGIHGVSYNSNLPFMTGIYDDTQYTMTEQGSAHNDCCDVAYLPLTEMHEIQPAQNVITSVEDTHNAPGDDCGPKWHNASSAAYISPGKRTRNIKNASKCPYPSDADHNNCAAYSTSTSSYSLEISDSPRSMTTFQHTNGNMPKSASCPTFTGWKKPAQPLTALQMVDEVTHQPTMDSVEVVLQHPDGKRKKVESMDYRDLSWQGRSDDHKGWTPSKSGEKERKKACRNQEAQDDEEIPRTADEKAAIVKLLFKAFKSTVEGQSNPQVQRPFEHQVHSNAHVEAVCWQLLEAAIQRSEGGPLGYAYEPEKGTKSALDRSSSFAQRIDDLIHALMWEKSVCINLLKAPKVIDAVDSPSYLGKRTANNRLLNGKKAEIAKLGKKKLEELEEEHADDFPRKISAATRPSSKRGKRSKNHLDDDDSESREESPPKRHSPDRTAYTTPAQRFAAFNSFDGYPSQVTPSSSQMASNNSTPPQRFASPSLSTTGSIRADMSGYSLNGLSQPNFTRSIPQSPLRQSASLSGVGTQHLPPHRYSAEYADDFLFANDDAGERVFF